MKPTGSEERKSNAKDIWIGHEIRIDISKSICVCIDNLDYPAALELHKIYRVIPDEEAALDGDIRVIDESGEDYLYLSLFCANSSIRNRSGIDIESFSISRIGGIGGWGAGGRYVALLTFSLPGSRVLARWRRFLGFQVYPGQCIDYPGLRGNEFMLYLE